MSNPYQPTRLVPPAALEEADPSRFCLGMGIVASVLATPLVSLFVLALSFALIHILGLQEDLRSLIQDRLDWQLATCALAAGALLGCSAYFASRSANYYFARQRNKGSVYLILSLAVSSAILVMICVCCWLYASW